MPALPATETDGQLVEVQGGILRHRLGREQVEVKLNRVIRVVPK